MAAMIDERNLSLAWLAALEHLLRGDGTETNLMVVIREPVAEDAAIRRALDAFIAGHSSVFPIATVANTIFPQSLYLERLGHGARDHLYAMHAQRRPVMLRHRASNWGTYFDRLVAWPDPRGEINQLERTIERLRGQIRRSNPLSSAYELGVSAVGDDDLEIETGCHSPDDSTAELRIHLPGRDNRVRGGPCLSHLSLTLADGQLHLSALYRNQHFIRRAYGNYLGLSRLLAFLCREVGCSMGEIACLATHADAEIGAEGGLGKRALTALARDARGAVEARRQIAVPA